MLALGGDERMVIRIVDSFELRWSGCARMSMELSARIFLYVGIG